MVRPTTARPKEGGPWDQVVAPVHGKLASLLNRPEAILPEVSRRLKKFLEPYERVETKLRKR